MKFVATRACLFCGHREDHPLTNADAWTAIPIADSRDEYWRCPRCTAEGVTEPAAHVLANESQTDPEEGDS